jgi:cyanate permease
LTAVARTDWPAVGVALAAGVAGAAYVGKLPTALPLLKSEFGLSLVTAGWVVSMFNTIGVLAALFFGIVADRFGALRFCMLGLALLACGGVFGMLAGDVPQLLASRFVEGAGFLAVAVAAPALIVTATAPQDRKLALGFWSGYLPFGFAVVVLLSPLALATVGWRGLWIGIAAFAALCLAALWRTRRAYAALGRSSRSLRDVTSALRQPGPWVVSLCMGLYTLQWSAVMTWLPTYLVQNRTASLVASALLLAVVVGVNVPGTLLGTWLVQRNVPRGRLIKFTFGVMALCNFAIFSDAVPDGGRYAAVIALSLFGGVIPAAVFSSSQRYARSAAQVGSLQGLIVQGSNMGQFVGPPAIAAVVSASGSWEAAVYVVVASAVLGLAAGTLVDRLEARPPV